MSEMRTVVGYMCMIDWEHELGNAHDGNKVYPSIEALKEHHPMWAECGIVEVEVRFRREVVPQDFEQSHPEETRSDEYEKGYQDGCSAARHKVDRLARCLGFFASVIKSGEPWTQTCEREYQSALREEMAAEQSHPDSKECGEVVESRPASIRERVQTLIAQGKWPPGD